jgi:hypothetical protein
MQTLTKIKGLGALLIAGAALLGFPGSAHAGNVYITFMYYTWQTTFTDPLYNTDGTAGPIVFTLNAYEYAGAATDAVGSTGPNGPNINEETIHIYEGGPANGSNPGFLTNVPYVEIVSGFHELYQFTIPETGQVVVIYALQWPYSLSPSQVPQ